MGNYTEIFFPNNDVRFIAIYDNVDSENGNNEFAPFKNIINEWYARDVSKKIRAVFQSKPRKMKTTLFKPLKFIIKVLVF